MPPIERSFSSRRSKPASDNRESAECTPTASAPRPLVLSTTRAGPQPTPRLCSTLASSSKPRTIVCPLPRRLPEPRQPQLPTHGASCTRDRTTPPSTILSAHTRAPRATVGRRRRDHLFKPVVFASVVAVGHGHVHNRPLGRRRRERERERAVVATATRNCPSDTIAQPLRLALHLGASYGQPQLATHTTTPCRPLPLPQRPPRTRYAHAQPRLSTVSRRAVQATPLARMGQAPHVSWGGGLGAYVVARVSAR